MKTMSRRVLVQTVGLGTMGALVGAPTRASGATGTAVGDSFPDAVYRTEDGRTQSVAASRGKVGMVYFWAVWCPICFNDIVNIQRIYDNFKIDPAFSPMVMNLMDDYRAGVAWARSRGITLPLYDSGMETLNSSVATTTTGTFRFPRATPQFYILDRQGTIVLTTSNEAAGTRPNYDTIQKLLEV